MSKPVSRQRERGRRIVETARKYDRICQTGTQCRSQEGSKKAIEYIQTGKIGEVKVARGLCYKTRRSIGPAGNFQPPSAVNYDLWCGPAPTAPITRRSFHYDWHWVWDFGNGDLGNQGIHQMDVARWGLGVDHVGYSVMSYGGRFGYEDAGETANTQVSVHDYGDKRLVFEVRGLSTQPLRGASVGVIFEGTDGFVVMTSYSSGAAFDLEGNKVAEFTGGGDHYGNFVEAVRNRKPETLNADILEGHLSSALCHLGNISYRLGDTISAAEVKQRLAEDEEASETLARFTDHLEENGVKLSETPVQFGPKLDIDPVAESFVGARLEARPCSHANIGLRLSCPVPARCSWPSEIARFTIYRGWRIQAVRHPHLFAPAIPYYERYRGPANVVGSHASPRNTL